MKTLAYYNGKISEIEEMMIPMNENTESLNASVAASVILWEYAKGIK